MKAILVSYDLNTPGQKYAKIDAYMKALGAHRVLETVWIIPKQRAANCQSVYAGIGAILDQNDRLLVVALVSEARWFLEASESTWMETAL